MKTEQKIWIALAAAGCVGALLVVIAMFASMPKGIVVFGTLIVCASIVTNLVLLFKHADRLQKIVHALSVGSQVRITAAYPPGSLLKDIGTATERFMDETNEKVKTLQNENTDIGLQLQLTQRRKNSVEAILNSIRDAVIVTDDRDRIILANTAAEKLFGFEFDRLRIIIANTAAEKLFGFEFDRLQPPAADAAVSSTELVTAITKCRTSKTAHVRHELTFEDGEDSVSCDTVLSCVEDDSGNVLQVVAVLHDVTREKEVSQMKNDFVSHVSHELKTPLASINAYAEMLVDGEAEDTETIQQFCGVIQGQAQRLSRLIEDILNISRIESGLVKVSKETHSLALVIRDSVEMIASYAQEKNITVHSPASILYDQVNIDRDMISQVVINLLSNAVKYTPAGGEITKSRARLRSQSRIREWAFPLKM
ncbi:MAG: histidine kinase dimerization/phospho-acceptor domain-containing protein [Planctomycetota bacterium]|jgi:two-component system phosphate regulon sensor histidine kinase PhoR